MLHVHPGAREPSETIRKHFSDELPKNVAFAAFQISCLAGTEMA